MLSSIASDGATGYPAFHVQRLLALLNAHFLASGTLDDTFGTHSRRWRDDRVRTRRSSKPRCWVGSRVRPVEASATVEAVWAPRSSAAERSRGGGAAEDRRSIRCCDRRCPLRGRVTPAPMAIGLSVTSWRRPAVGNGGKRQDSWRSSEREEDVRVLRLVAKEMKGQFRQPDLGRSLARRVADPVYVDDLGRLVIWIGKLEIAGTSDSKEGPRTPLLPVGSAADVGHARPGSRCTVARSRSWSGRQLTASDGLLPSSCVRARIRRGPAAPATCITIRTCCGSTASWLPAEAMSIERLLTDDRELSQPRPRRSVSRSSTSASSLLTSHTRTGRHRFETRCTRDTSRLSSAPCPHDADAGQIDRAIRLAQRALDVDPHLDEVEKTVIQALHSGWCPRCGGGAIRPLRARADATSGSTRRASRTS